MGRRRIEADWGGMGERRGGEAWKGLAESKQAAG